MRLNYPTWRLWLFLAALAAANQGCSERGTLARGTTTSSKRGSATPDVAPTLLNKQLPFRYPLALYAMHVEGDVTLRLFVTAAGEVLPESTRVVTSSGYHPLDSAAVSGSTELQFSPARNNGKAEAVSILFPVLFRHPER